MAWDQKGDQWSSDKYPRLSYLHGLHVLLPFVHVDGAQAAARLSGAEDELLDERNVGRGSFLQEAGVGELRGQTAC